MKNSRRDFLGLGLAMGLTPLVHADPLASLFDFSTNQEPLNILILGGTSFLGPHQIAYALERGHKVSIFTRGKTKPKIHEELFSKVESLVGDREDNLEALKNREWDVVIDNSGRKAQWTEDTAKLLKERSKIYVYTSSISVYYPFVGDDFSETRKLVTKIPEDTPESEKATFEFGVMKANSEIAAIDNFGKDRTIIVRPTLIVGPGDPTDRFPYWVARLEKGGDIIIPGGRDEVIQYIDVRDLAQWMIRLAENKAIGIYNGSGPGYKMTVPEFVHGIHASFSSPVNYIQIDDTEFLSENGIIALQPWVIQFPKYAGMSMSDNSKAKASGLTYRPLSKTVDATVDWWYSDAVSQDRRGAILTNERALMPREKEILEKWAAKKG